MMEDIRSSFRKMSKSGRYVMSSARLTMPKMTLRGSVAPTGSDCIYCRDRKGRRDRLFIFLLKEDGSAWEMTEEDPVGCRFKEDLRS